MESLVPSSHSTGPPPRGHQKLSDKHEVQYFACGQLSGRTLVVYLRKKGVSGFADRSLRLPLTNFAPHTDQQRLSLSGTYHGARNGRESKPTGVHTLP